ncbi:MAG: NAD+ synthase [Alphaproteobacteria bacterium]|nr:NAD+ synthase [Alphaproteobacteria bacterium]
MSQKLKITCAQLNPKVGDFENNRLQIEKTWKENDSSDLILFPELFLIGYPPEDLVLNVTFVKEVKIHLRKLLHFSESKNAAALIPVVLKEDNSLFNAAVLIQAGKEIFRTYKRFLPNYTIFDEHRTFAQGPMPTPFKFKGFNLGFMICEDLWYEETPMHLAKQGADILITINGSPYHDTQAEIRKKLFQKNLQNIELPLIYLNMHGGQDELVFDGQSFVMDKENDIVYQSPVFEDDVFHVFFDNDLKVIGNPAPPYERLEIFYKALVEGTKDYVHKNGFSRVLLGLSGGIDSALVAAIAVDALGAKNVRCVMLPSEFTADESLRDARECAENLGVSYEIISIKDVVKSFEGAIPNLSGLAHENTQSRIRGSVLMALSNASGEMLLTTGNKSEMAVGYCTLYGDMNGGFNPLKDVYKTDVYKLSEWHGKIPKNIITKEPTAELRANQKDQDSLPPYDLLDDILRLLIEYDHIDWDKEQETELTEMRERVLQQPEEVMKVARLLKNSEFKRYQSAPGPRVTSHAFGKARRYPLTNGFTNKV